MPHDGAACGNRTHDLRDTSSCGPGSSPYGSVRFRRSQRRWRLRGRARTGANGNCWPPRWHHGRGLARPLTTPPPGSYGRLFRSWASEVQRGSPTVATSPRPAQTPRARSRPFARMTSRGATSVSHSAGSGVAHGRKVRCSSGPGSVANRSASVDPVGKLKCMTMYGSVSPSWYHAPHDGMSRPCSRRNCSGSQPRIGRSRGASAEDGEAMKIATGKSSNGTPKARRRTSRKMTSDA